MTPYLTDAEIADICAPLTAPSAQCRYLARIGLIVKAKPNGRPLVARGEFERVLIGRSPELAQNGPGQPNRDALLKLIKGGKRGAQAQGR
jgi:hypothetical protein